MENRTYPRMVINLAMNYCINLQDSNESLRGRGLLKNISQGGMFFKCFSPIGIENGNMGKFSMDLNPSPGLRSSRLTVSGRVVRIEPPEKNTPKVGIAVQFISNLNMQLSY